LAHGVQFNASYTYSHSIDNNSRNAEGIVSQNSNNIGGERGSSDFDVRHRFTINSIYDLPFKASVDCRLGSGNHRHRAVRKPVQHSARDSKSHWYSE